LVAEVAEERDRQKSKQRHSIIGSLIDDAMMEFTSLDPQQRHKSFRTLHSTTSSLASQPLDVLGSGGQEWTSSLGLESIKPNVSASPGYGLGNLAALEEIGSSHPSLPPLQRLGQGFHPGMPGVPRGGLNSPVPSPGSSPAAGSGGQVASAETRTANAAAVATTPPSQAGVAQSKAKPMSTSTLAIVVVLVVVAGAAGALLSGAIQ
jgi:hypothetical protein